MVRSFDSGLTMELRVMDGGGAQNVLTGVYYSAYPYLRTTQGIQEDLDHRY